MFRRRNVEPELESSRRSAWNKIERKLTKNLQDVLFRSRVEEPCSAPSNRLRSLVAWQVRAIASKSVPERRHLKRKQGVM